VIGRKKGTQKGYLHARGSEKAKRDSRKNWLTDPRKNRNNQKIGEYELLPTQQKENREGAVEYLL